MSFQGKVARILAVFTVVCGISAAKPVPSANPATGHRAEAMAGKSKTYEKTPVKIAGKKTAVKPKAKDKQPVATDMDEDWPKTFALLKNHSDSVAGKLLTWIYVVETPLPVEPQQLLTFIRQNPTWPKLYLFRAKIEKNISAWKDQAAVAAWFDAEAPDSFNGMKAYLDALIATHQAAKARTALSAFWLDAELNKNETAAMVGSYKFSFAPGAHEARLDNLIWNQRYAEAEYMLAFVNADARVTGQARIAIARMDKSADRLLADVPAQLQKNEGLLFERLRMRRRKNNDSGAMEIIAAMPQHTTHPESWWGELNILARRRMEVQDFSGAYKIIAKHQLTEGMEFAQAEWQLGWLSLRKLNNPLDAYKHFDGMFRKVTTAISLARGAYWAARAAEVSHDANLQQQWDKVAAQYPSTFYGQLSFEKVYGRPAVTGFKDASPAAATVAAFNGNELVRAARILHTLKLKHLIDPFLARLNADAKTRDDYALVAQLARETERYYYAVQANKDCQQTIGQFLFTEGYPVLPSLPLGNPEKSLVHAIIHRESMFNTEALSPVGARGLMQLMPGTAKMMAKRAGETYSLDKLTGTPSYNVRLGETYLAGLVDSYGGFYPMAIAAYNAGPGNVQEWINAFGDPRRGNIDVIDWIESIPIYETRNYIQRVMESYYIYRLRFGQPPKTILDFVPKK